jgi:hypothetical protein
LCCTDRTVCFGEEFGQFCVNGVFGSVLTVDLFGVAVLKSIFEYEVVQGLVYDAQELCFVQSLIFVYVVFYQERSSIVFVDSWVRGVLVK